MVPTTGIRRRLSLAWCFFKATLRALLGMTPILDMSIGDESLHIVRQGENVCLFTRFVGAAIDPANARGMADALYAAANDIDPLDPKANTEPIVVGKCNQCQAVITDEEPWHVEADGFVLCQKCGDHCSV